MRQIFDEEIHEYLTQIYKDSGRLVGWMASRMASLEMEVMTPEDRKKYEREMIAEGLVDG